MGEQRQKKAALDINRIRDVLEYKLNFTDGRNYNLVTTTQDEVVVEQDSIK